MKAFGLFGSLSGMEFTSVRRAESAEAMRTNVLADHGGVNVCCVKELPQDCDCQTHDGPHWMHMDELDRARVQKHIAARNPFGAFQEDGPRLARKKREIDRLGRWHEVTCACPTTRTPDPQGAVRGAAPGTCLPGSPGGKGAPKSDALDAIERESRGEKP